MNSQIYKSRRSRFVYGIAFIFLFFTILFGLGSIVLIFSFNPLGFLTLILSSASLIFSYEYFTYAPSVTITDAEIIIKRKRKEVRILKENVVDFKFSGVFPAPNWMSFSGMIGFSITTKQGDEYVFLEKLYANSHELRTIFSRLVNGISEQRHTALDNPLTVFTSPLKIKGYLTFLCVSLIAAFSPLFSTSKVALYLCVFAFFTFFIILWLLVNDILHFLTIEVEGKAIHFKRKLPFCKEKVENLDNIATCNLTYLKINKGYSGYAFSYYTSDYKRQVFKGDNLEPDVWNELLILLEKNGVPITDFSFETVSP